MVFFVLLCPQVIHLDTLSKFCQLGLPLDHTVYSFHTKVVIFANENVT